MGLRPTQRNQNPRVFDRVVSALTRSSDSGSIMSGNSPALCCRCRVCARSADPPFSATPKWQKIREPDSEPRPSGSGFRFDAIIRQRPTLPFGLRPDRVGEGLTASTRLIRVRRPGAF